MKKNNKKEPFWNGWLHDNGHQWKILILLGLIPKSYSHDITVSSSVPAGAISVYLIESSSFNDVWHNLYTLYLCLFKNVKALSNDPGEKAIERRLLSLISPVHPGSELITSQETNFGS